MEKLKLGIVEFERVFCEGAVLSWYLGVGDSNMKNKRELSTKVKKHLSAMGWVFFCASKAGRPEMRYQSPSGKVFYSLKTACKSYMDGQGSSGVAADGDLKPKQPLKRKSFCLENQAAVEGSWSVAGDLKPKQPMKRKSLSLESHKSAQTLPLPPPKRRKKPKKQKKPAKPRMLSSKRVREGPLPDPSHGKPRTVLSWLIDNNAVSNMARVYYRNKAGNPLKRGRILRNGIQCDCCFTVLTLTAFEAHAGSTNHRPSANIILDDGSGMSLSDCQKRVRDSTMNKVESPKTVKDNPFQHKNDELCSACRDGGDLICCDNCPSSFHVNCLGLKAVPDGDWFCPSCCCGICCVGYVSDDSFLTCQQCERKFHVGCLGLQESNDLKNHQNVKSWFCGHRCEKIFSGLRKLIGKPISVGNNLTWTLLNSEACSESDGDTGLAHGLEASAENHSKMSVALEVMHECFEPTKDVYTGRDIVEDVIFNRGSKLKRLNFKGFYTAILEENDDLVSVATLRVYGDRVAEMPLVATRFTHRRCGMCRVLVNEVEKNLAKLGVQKLILPAVPSAVETWTNNFGFSHMTDDERSELLQYTFLDFQGTIMCQKLLKSDADL
ncbi:hypothetical protein PTKIN_Ptkin09bG0147900 [Pterospermum kingtungense]